MNPWIPNQTHLIQIIKVFRIIRNFQAGVIWSWLELNSAELWPSRNWVWDHCSKAMLAALMRLFFWSQLLHLTHSTRTQLLWSTLARPVPSETRLGKPLYDPGHCTVTQFQVVTDLLTASAIFVESNNSNSQILREFFAMLNIQWSVWENCTQRTTFLIL